MMPRWPHNAPAPCSTHLPRRICSCCVLCKKGFWWRWRGIEADPLTLFVCLSTHGGNQSCDGGLVEVVQGVDGDPAEDLFAVGKLRYLGALPGIDGPAFLTGHHARGIQAHLCSAE